jgi:hypothetical protein
MSIDSRRHAAFAAKRKKEKGRTEKCWVAAADDRSTDYSQPLGRALRGR